MASAELMLAIAIQTAVVCFAAGVLVQQVRGLDKRLERIERVLNHSDFWHVSKAGRSSDD